MDKPRTPRQALPNSAALMRELVADTAGYPAGCNVHLFPDGSFQSNDGRPARLTEGKCTHWKMDQTIADALIAAHVKPILFDHDHESIYGSTAAAGWITALTYEAGRGLFGRAEWVADTAEEIAGKVYRYLSPYFVFDAASGAILKIYSVALTNDPALDDLGAVALNRNPQEPNLMEPSQQAALAAERDSLRTQLTALSAERDSLKTQVTALQKQIDDAALTAETREKEALIAAACTGDKAKMTPAMAEFAKDLSLAALKKFIETAPPLSLTQMQAATRGDGGDGLSDEERAMCARMGVTPDQFKAAKAAKA